VHDRGSHGESGDEAAVVAWNPGTVVVVVGAMVVGVVAVALLVDGAWAVVVVVTGAGAGGSTEKSVPVTTVIAAVCVGS